jgi:hypothetical protein
MDLLSSKRSRAAGHKGHYGTALGKEMVWVLKARTGQKTTETSRRTTGDTGIIGRKNPTLQGKIAWEGGNPL